MDSIAKLTPSPTQLSVTPISVKRQMVSATPAYAVEASTTTKTPNPRKSMSKSASILAAIGAILLVVVITVGGYLGGWWLNENAVNRQGRINNKSFARQNALREDALDKKRTALDIDVQLTQATPEQSQALRAQRVAVISQFCDDVAQMTGAQIPDTIATFANQECN